MKFKGIVSRGKYERNAKIIAKIVAPSKLTAKEVEFNVKIKAEAISDSEKCLMVLNQHKTDFSRLGETILSDIFLGSGQFMSVITNTKPDTENGTTTVFDIAPALAEYVNVSTGEIKRPPYGEENINGYVRITTSIGNVSVSAVVPVALNAVTPAEALAFSNDSIEEFWRTVCNSNSYSDGAELMNDMNLIDQLHIPALSDSENISITWEITDAASSTLGSGARVSESNGVGELNYVSFVTAKENELTLKNNGIYVDSSNKNDKFARIIIGGVTVKAELNLNGTKKTLERSFCVSSDYITVEDIFEDMNNNGGGKFVDGGFVDISGTPKVITSMIPFNVSTNVSLPHQILVGSTAKYMSGSVAAYPTGFTTQEALICVPRTFQDLGIMVLDVPLGADVSVSSIKLYSVTNYGTSPQLYEVAYADQSKWPDGKRPAEIYQDINRVMQTINLVGLNSATQSKDYVGVAFHTPQFNKMLDPSVTAGTYEPGLANFVMEVEYTFSGYHERSSVNGKRSTQVPQKKKTVYQTFSVRTGAN